MIPTLLLVPTSDNSGQPFDPDLFRTVESRLLEAFGGWNRTVDAIGDWKDDDGTVYRDHLRQYRVAIPSWHDLATFLEVVEWVRAECEQESVYVEIAGFPEILGPPP